jgi:aspartyl protease
MIEFPFLKRRSEKFGYILKPVIPVGIIGPKRGVKVFMLLDSGADISMVPYSVGETIGIELDMSTRSEVQGIGEGSVPYVLGQVRIQIENFEISARIGWALIEEVPFILGRLDIFKAFAVEFREFENKILLKQPGE